METRIEELLELLRQRRAAQAQWTPRQQKSEAVLQKVLQLQEKVAREFPDFKPSSTTSTQQ